ncbi:MAG: hypothetical protein SO082_00655 [Candidatus Limisoma sp.]|nr:hypothetical protein [Candidatus Limisoma sp.]
MQEYSLTNLLSQPSISEARLSTLQSCTGLSTSGTEPGVTHNSCTSGTATTAVSTTWLRSRVGILTASSVEWLPENASLRLGVHLALLSLRAR